MTNPGNLFVPLSLVGWSLFCISAPRLFPPALAVSVGVVGGVLFLPQGAGWDLPGLPPLTSYSLPAATLLLGLLLSRSKPIRLALPFRGFDIGIIGMILVAIGTVLTNPEDLVYPIRKVSGLRAYDWVSVAGSIFLTFGIPYYLGRCVFRTASSLRTLYLAIIFFSLGYSLLALWEMRFSPQLHLNLYGYRQHVFGQSIRGGGYRPMIFMSHGISVADFFFLSTFLAVALGRRRKLPHFSFGNRGYLKRRIPVWTIPAWLVFLVFILRSLGAQLLSVFSFPLLIFAKPRTQLIIALVIATLVSFYFVGQARDSIPSERAVELIRHIDEDRAQSLQSRFNNEHLLFEKARQKALFGWGAKGRSRIYRHDGKDITRSDGYWVIMLGREGALGLACRLFMFIGPIFLIFFRRKEIDPKRFVLVAPLCLLIALKSFDMLLNATSVTALSAMLAGVLAGQAESARVRVSRPGNRNLKEQPNRGSHQLESSAQAQDSDMSTTIDELNAGSPSSLGASLVKRPKSP